MRNFLLLLGIMTICSMSYSQESNLSRLKQIKTELDRAIQNQDYEQAAELKKEIDIREKIEEAVGKNDFKEASRLKEQLGSSEPQKEQVSSEDIQSIDSKRFPTPSEGKAIVEFVKVTVQGWNAETMLFDGEQYIGSVWGVSHMRIEVDPGQHLFWMNITDKMGYLDATLEANKVYIVIIDMAETAFSNAGLSPATMDNIGLVDRAKRVIHKHPVKVTAKEDITKTQSKLEKKGFIEKQLAKYEKKYKTSAKTHVLSSEMNIPLDYLRH